MARRSVSLRTRASAQGMPSGATALALKNAHQSREVVMIEAVWWLGNGFDLCAANMSKYFVLSSEMRLARQNRRGTCPRSCSPAETSRTSACVSPAHCPPDHFLENDHDLGQSHEA